MEWLAVEMFRNAYQPAELAMAGQFARRNNGASKEWVETGKEWVTLKWNDSGI